MKKRTLLLSFEEDALKDARRILFRHGISPQEYLTYVLDQLSLQDERTADLLNEIAEKKKNDFIEKGGDEERKRLNKRYEADSLYQAIEESLQKEYGKG